jgi:hypothetical protein
METRKTSKSYSPEVKERAMMWRPHRKSETLGLTEPGMSVKLLLQP